MANSKGQVELHVTLTHYEMSQCNLTPAIRTNKMIEDLPAFLDSCDNSRDDILDFFSMPARRSEWFACSVHSKSGS
jgi:hypothetical protein